MDGTLQISAGDNVRAAASPTRRRWRISGRVQGVGFRPFVYRLAARLGIRGSVCNDGFGVVIEGQATAAQLDRFAQALQSEAPPAATLRQFIAEELPPLANLVGFAIEPSATNLSASAEVAADMAVCPDCLAEMRDPANLRRHGYALTNCTHCGPRYSILRAIPYDRRHTTLAGFSMCGACQSEYDDPADRRFHAQPIACRDCGPQIRLVDAAGQSLPGDPIEQTVQRLAAGQIVAIKGIGGFHLAVRADAAPAVQRLRALKHRPTKPFALMCASLRAANQLADFTPAGQAALTSPVAPIVLGRRKAHAPVAAAVAPQQHRLGIMLAYTPLHHLLFDVGRAMGLQTLVMTSANDVDEPLVYDDSQAVARLGQMCDALLLHNRPIERALDDSVVIDASNGILPLRRARGLAPEPLQCRPSRAEDRPAPLANEKELFFRGGAGPSSARNPAACAAPPGLALGAELKNTIALCRDTQIILSQHLGNLTQTRSFDAFRRAIADLCALFDISPQWIAHDLHPAYLSTQEAKKMAGDLGCPLIGVQHHHAHAAAVLAENQFNEPALAIVCDGAGFASDGSIWGGELLRVDLTGFTRLGHLRCMPLAGGDACAKYPWRSAMSLLHAAFDNGFADLPLCRELANSDERAMVAQMLCSNACCVSSSSAGRVFDGVAALLGLCRHNHYEAEAPCLLEAAASQAASSLPLNPADWRLHQSDGLIQIDWSGLIRRMVAEISRGAKAAELALFFHQALAAALADAALQASRATGLKTVALSGGVFANELFAAELSTRLQAMGLNVLCHRRLPPNDGSVAFGQAAVAQARLARGICQG